MSDPQHTTGPDDYPVPDKDDPVYGRAENRAPTYIELKAQLEFANAMLDGEGWDEVRKLERQLATLRDAAHKLLDAHAHDDRMPPTPAAAQLSRVLADLPKAAAGIENHAWAEAVKNISVQPNVVGDESPDEWVDKLNDTLNGWKSPRGWKSPEEVAQLQKDRDYWKKRTATYHDAMRTGWQEMVDAKEEAEERLREVQRANQELFDGAVEAKENLNSVTEAQNKLIRLAADILLSQELPSPFIDELRDYRRSIIP